jgi:hypothetical protein
MLGVGLIGDRRLEASWRGTFGQKVRIFTGKKKKQKERSVGRGEACGNCAAVEIDQGGLRQLLLDDFHRCLKKACAKTAPAFFTVPHRPDRD